MKIYKLFSILIAIALVFPLTSCSGEREYGCDCCNKMYKASELKELKFDSKVLYTRLCPECRYFAKNLAEYMYEEYYYLGIDIGYDEGYDVGTYDGHDAGYEDGYEDGWNAAVDYIYG